MRTRNLLALLVVGCGGGSTPDVGGPVLGRWREHVNATISGEPSDFERTELEFARDERHLARDRR